MTRLAAFILRGPNQATLAVILFAGLSLFLPLVGLVSSAAVALVALRKGFAESARVAAGATLAMCLGGVLVADSILAPTLYVALMWLPVWLVALLLRTTRQLGWAMEFGSLLGSGAIVAIYSLVPDPASMWEERLHVLLAALAQRTSGAELPLSQPFGTWFASYLTGILAAGSVMSLFVSLFLARWWQAVLFNPGGFGAEFTTLRFHKLTHYLALLGLGLALTAGGAVAEVCWNLLIVLGVLFVMLGLSILHRTLSSKANRRFWLAGLYLLALFLPQTLLPVALLGITDVWIDWRGRWAQ